MAHITPSLREARALRAPVMTALVPALASAALLLPFVPASAAPAALGLGVTPPEQGSTQPAPVPPAGTPPGGESQPPTQSPAPSDNPSSSDKPVPEKPSPTTPSPAGEVAPTAAAPAGNFPDRAAAYQSFKDHFASRRFAEALPAAEALVALTEKQYGPDDDHLINPLLNMGTTQMRLGNLFAAESTYRRALRIAEARDGGYSRSVIEPLHALGVTYQASGRYGDAAESLKRAVDVSRKLDGLFNIQQLPLVEALVSSYIALDKRAEVDREQQYAMRLSENTYGRDDPRMLPVLARNADWCESTGRYRMARQAHARALEILGHTKGKLDPAVVIPLRGIARTYRLEFLYGTSEQADLGQRDFNPSLTPQLGGLEQPSRPQRLDPDGEAALKKALVILVDHPEQAGMRGETLLDLGDWYMLSSRFSEAQRLYRDAWASFTTPNGPGPALMSQPAEIYYRAPSSSIKRADRDEEDTKESFVEVQFKVSADGRVSDVKTVTTDATESQEKSVQMAIRRARYRPRFVDGKPVDTEGVRYRQTLYSTAPSGKST